LIWDYVVVCGGVSKMFQSTIAIVTLHDYWMRHVTRAIEIGLLCADWH